MNFIHSIKKEGFNIVSFLRVCLLAIVLVLLWQTLPVLIHAADQTAGSIDPSIWLLLLLGQTAFVLQSKISWLLIKWFWNNLGLPGVSIMVSKFRSLELWQQLSFPGHYYPRDQRWKEWPFLWASYLTA